MSDIVIINSNGTNNVPIGGPPNINSRYSVLKVLGNPNDNLTRYSCLYLYNSGITDCTLTDISVNSLDTINIGFQNQGEGGYSTNVIAELLTDNITLPTNITFTGSTFTFNEGTVLSPKDYLYFWIELTPSTDNVRANHTATLEVNWI